MTAEDQPITIRGIIPAAGLSRRMGRTKQCLPFEASTITGTVAAAMLSAGVDTLVVVTRTDLASQLDLPGDSRLTVIFNDDPSSEMIDSIRLALKHATRRWQQSTRTGCDTGSAAECDMTCDHGIMVVPGDMPTVPLIAYQRSMLAFKKDPSRIIIASHHGRRGHPMIFPATLSIVLHDVQGGLNELPRRFPDLVRTVEVSDPGVMQDIDAPSDYEMLRIKNEGSSTPRTE